jgi:starch synthase
MTRLKILYLAAEVVPFAKTGGLADVAGALPKAIRALGHDIRVVMPRYGRIDRSSAGLTSAAEGVNVTVDERVEQATILAASIGTAGAATPVYFVDNARYFDRQGIYMYPDDAERFVFFCRAALEACRVLEWQPDVIHCNEWHTALVPNWLRTIYRDDPFFNDTATIYTAHNLEFQGIFGYRVLEIAGLADHGFLAHPDVAPDLNYVVDLVARGLLFADMINTVSETHAAEILTPEYGHGLDPILRDRRDRLFGILNGIDTEVCNPATDPFIAVQYSASSLERRLGNKAALQAEVGLQVQPEAPLIGIVSRLTDQKGFDLIGEAIRELAGLDLQIVVLGTGQQEYHDLFQQISSAHPGKIAVRFEFNNPLAHQIEAGADMFLMPSKFEPCGLNQLYSLRYGTVPIVRATGGLADTVKNFDLAGDSGTGFSFQEYAWEEMMIAVKRALMVYSDPIAWEELMLRGMAEDWSWEQSARKYVRLYEEIRVRKSR